MKSFLILFLIISPLHLFGQQIVNVTLIDGSSYRGEIFRYDESEIKLALKKKKFVTIAKADIVSPKQIIINPAYFTTRIMTTDKNWYEGEIIIENDTVVTLELGKELFKRIEKSDIVIRSNRAKRKKSFIETTIYTKNGDKLIGEVLDKNDEYTMIDIDKKMQPQKIKNQNIKSETEVYKKRVSSLRKVLIVVGSLYILPGLFAI